MSNIITVNDLNSTKFYQLPKAFFHNPIYTDMKNESKIAYTILRDLLELSVKNNWINDKNEVYVKLSREKMMKYLNIKGSQKYSAIIKELVEKELIVKKRVGLNRVDETYICIPEELNDIYSDEELLELEEKTQEKDASNPIKSREFQNQTSGSSKIKPPEVLKSNLKKFENQTHTNTNITKTNFNTSSSKKENDSNIFNFFEDNICKLRKTTSIKFAHVVKNVDEDFLKAIIEECTMSNVKSYKGFEVALQSYLDRNCKTAEDVINAANEYRESKKKQYKEKKTTNYVKNKKTLTFTDYEQRSYDYDSLEKKLLGWE